MTRLRLLLLALVAFLVIVGAAAWWFLFAPNGVAAAELVPGDTIAFATIPNAVSIITGYQTSQLKTLVDSPNAQPLIEEIQKDLGDKNLALFKTFLPNLSGQSFIAITHIDSDQIGKIGFIAGMRPKASLTNFDTFVQQWKTTYPDLLAQAKIGTGNVAGVDYQSIQGPGATDKFCVARVKGWIVVSWGEASLQDWLERLDHKSTTSSLAQNSDYLKSLDRIGKDSQAILYANYPRMMELVEKQLAKTNSTQASFLTKKLAPIGGIAMGTRFENGEIVDRFSFLEPRQAQIDRGMSASPCPFETLKFTGPETHFYLGACLNWKQLWKNFQEQRQANPALSQGFTALQNWAQNENLDLQRNILDPLGSEYSLQMEWGAYSPYPEIGFFLKLDKPDDFKPTINAIIETLRKTYATTAVIEEIKAVDRSFAVLKPVQPIPISPTITEDGPYLGVFLTENQAVRSFQRTESIGLLQNTDFKRQIGERRQNASEVIFVDTPKLLDRAYRTALPYASMASMFNPKVAATLQNHQLPPDVTWLAPMGTWSLVISSDEEGILGYSTSGIGNQGIFGGGALAGVAMTLGETIQKLYPQPAPLIPSNPYPTYPANLTPTAGGQPAAPAPSAETPPATNSDLPLSNATPSLPPSRTDAVPTNAPTDSH